LLDSLVDSNVLIYAYDPRDTGKQRQAALVLATLVERGSGVLSVQCLAEFVNVTTKKLPEPLTRHEAQAQVERLSAAFRVVDLTPLVVIEGCRGSADHGLSFWDTLIWSAAKLNQVPIILTEDAEHGRMLEGIRYLNPFDPTFELASLE
jgi:predicted nucleic acid-binding protein